MTALTYVESSGLECCINVYALVYSILRTIGASKPNAPKHGVMEVGSFYCWPFHHFEHNGI